MKESSGLLLYRRGAQGWDVLLVHSSGWYNRGKPWGIPKGLIDTGETPRQAAVRETCEETGVVVPVDAEDTFMSLGAVDYASGKKRVHCFAAEAAADVVPKCASWEIDAARFMPLDEARTLIHRDQAAFLDRLEAWLAEQSGGRLPKPESG